MRWWQIKRHQEEIERELESDLALGEEEGHETGLPREEARWAARRALGNTTLIREQTYEVSGWTGCERFLQDIRYGLRQIRKAPGFTVAVVGTLALGIASATAIFCVVYSTLLRTLPYPEAYRIVRIDDVRTQGRSAAGLMKVPRFFDLTARSQSLEDIAFYYFENSTLIADAHLPVAVRSAVANANFWRVFGGTPLLGRTFSERDDRPNAPPVAVLSYKGWKQIFSGDAKVVGRRVTIGQKATTIIGVMPERFNVPNGIDLWSPAEFDPGRFTWRGAGSGFLNVFGLVRPGLSIKAVQSDLARIGKQLQREYPETDGIWRFSGVPYRDALYGELRPALLILWAASGLLLLMGCINVANLVLTRAATRAHQIALQRALGASEGRIRLQFLTESVLLSLAGGWAGLSLAWALLRLASSHLPGKLGVPGTIEVNAAVVWFAFGVSVASGIVFGLAPTLRRTHSTASLIIRDLNAVRAAHGWVRNAYISVQVGLSFILLVGAALLGQSLWNLLKAPLGFAPEHLLTFEISLPWSTDQTAIRRFFSDAEQRLEALPGVTEVGQIDALPTVDWHLRSNFDADWLPRDPNHPAIGAEDRHIAGNFFPALGATLVAGRAFTPQDQQPHSKSVLVNQELTKEYLPDGNPIGRHLIVGSESFEIVGIMADVRGTAGSIAKPPGPEVYWPADADEGVVERYFVVRSQIPPNQLINSIRDQVHQVDPLQAISHVATMDELLDGAVAQPRLNSAIIAAFAALTLLLACIGIYGVVAWTVTQSTREIGVRMAIGATRAQISLLFLKRAIRATCIGIAGGVAGALLLMQFLRSQLYGITPENPWPYVVSIPLLLIPVLLATFRPALRAATINPVDALRTE